MSANYKPIRIGIVGCGAVTRECHLPALGNIPGVEITVLCDRAEQNALTAKGEFGLAARVTRDPADLKGQVDAAIVAVPPRFHAPTTMELLAAGIDVFCEKPLAVTVAEGEQMVAAAAQHQRHLAVGLMTRFEGSNALLRKFLHDPLLGEVREVIAESGTQLAWAMVSNAYYDKAQTGGGVFFDAGVHLLDRVLWLFGDLTDVEFEDDSYGGVESNARLRGQLTLQGRAVPCRMAFSWTHALANCIRVVGTGATLEARLKDPNTLYVTRQIAGEDVQMLVPAPDKPLGVYQKQLDDFIEAVRTRRAPFVTGASAVKSLQLIEKAYSVRRRLAQPWVETFAPLS